MTIPTPGLKSGGFNPSLKTVSDDVSVEASFLASEHIVVKRDGATFDSSIPGADANGYKILDAGTVVGVVTATGKYGAYDNTANDGRATAVGILVEGINLRDGDVIAGVLLHGSVLEARCSGIDAGGKADLIGQIIFQ